MPVFYEDSGAVLQPIELARANWELDIILFFDGSQHFEIRNLSKTQRARPQIILENPAIESSREPRLDLLVSASNDYAFCSLLK